MTSHDLDGHAESSGSRGSRIRSLSARLALELVVVFIGVYAASAFSQYQAKKSALERQRQVQSALIAEIQDLTSHTRPVAENLPRQVAQFDSAVAAGKRPALEPWIEPVRVETHMWDVTLQSDVLNLFDVPTVYSLSQFYNELNLGFAQLAQLREMSQSVLIPNMEKGPDEFYEPGNGQLRPKYQWYRIGLGNLAQLATSITKMGDSLAIVLNKDSIQ